LGQLLRRFDVGGAADYRGARAHRQREREDAPLPRRALDRHPAALELDEFLYQRQPEAGAAELAPRRAVDLAELLEDHLVVLRIDADALVAHRDRDAAVVGTLADVPHRDRDRRL